MADIQAKLSAESLFSKAVVFGEGGAVIASTCSPEDGEIQALLTAFDDRDTTVGKGVQFAGNAFEVHRWYEDPALVYGRRGDADSGEGFCLARATAASGANIFALVTYEYPNISAKCIPVLQELLGEFGGHQPSVGTIWC